MTLTSWLVVLLMIVGSPIAAWWLEVLVHKTCKKCKKPFGEHYVFQKCTAVAGTAVPDSGTPAKVDTHTVVRSAPIPAESLRPDRPVIILSGTAFPEPVRAKVTPTVPAASAMTVRTADPAPAPRTAPVTPLSTGTRTWAEVKSSAPAAKTDVVSSVPTLATGSCAPSGTPTPVPPVTRSRVRPESPMEMTGRHARIEESMTLDEILERHRQEVQKINSGYTGSVTATGRHARIDA
jgi:hypothetical protein